MHLIKFCPVDWVKHMEKINQAVGEKNRLDISGGKIWLVHPFRRQEFWKCIRCVLSAVTYVNKGHNILGGGQTQLYVDK